MIKNGRQTKGIYISLLSVYIENLNIVLGLIKLCHEPFTFEVINLKMFLM